METTDIPYLLGHARFHRGMERTTKCCEACSVHHQFVKNYQKRLLAIRRTRRPVAQNVRASSLPHDCRAVHFAHGIRTNPADTHSVRYSRGFTAPGCASAG
jgi:hypothetical protein